MSIPESQLETWCSQGAIVTSAAAYDPIKAALAAPRSKVRDLNPEIHLLGSPGDSTNIHADSDVDVVVQYHSAWYPDLSKLPAYQQEAYHAADGKATSHSWLHQSWVIDPVPVQA